MNPMTPNSQRISVNISATLYEDVLKRCNETGETFDNLIQHALEKALGVEHHTLFQVSTSTALVQGVYKGCTTVSSIKTYGNFGLGTYDALNGEGLMLDGHVFQALSDGTVVEPDKACMVPFWVSTQFVADRTAKLPMISSLNELCSQVNQYRPSENLFYAMRIDGLFEMIHYRVANKSSPGIDLVSATSQQTEFRLNNIEGTLLGFWSPDYAKSFNIPGYHLHFLSSNHQHAGHVLEICGKNLTLQIMDINKMMVIMPKSESFLKADLSKDPTIALSKAEGANRGNTNSK